MRKLFLYSIIFQLVFIVPLILNIFIFKGWIIGLIFGIPYILLNSYLAGFLLFKKEVALWKIFYGLLIFLNINSLLGAIIYYFYELNNFVIGLLIILIPATFLFIVYKSKTKYSIFNIKYSNIQYLIFQSKKLILPIIYLLLTALNFYQLFLHQTTSAIRSPWDLLSSWFFITYFAATAVLIIYTLKTKNKLSLILISLHTFLSLSIALIIYKLGYGYDPFIHQAAEKVILTQGKILPKNPYYLGQYSLVIYLTKLLSLPHVWIDKLLVPLLAAICIPATIYFSFKKYLLPLLFLTIPFGAFIMTTPQGLGNLFLILIIFLSYKYLHEKKINWPPLILLNLAALLIHPLAGLPALILLILLFFQTRFKGKTLYYVSSALLSLIIPAIFYLQSLLSKNLQTIIKFIPQNIFSWPLLVRKFDALLDFVYLYAWNFGWWILAISILGIYLMYKKYRDEACLVPTVFSTTFLILIINYLILTFFFNFQGLIAYEQQDYAGRILQISWYFLLPFYFYAFAWLSEKFWNKNLIYKTFYILIIAVIITSTLYISYPRWDNYKSNHGYNLSEADIATVHYIKENAKSDYIVLANQMTSVAALKEFGFAKYYKTNLNEIFYYPIPTGGPLYEYYLKMVYENASRKNILQAMDLTGVNTAYLVINDYWWRAPITIEEAKISANKWVKLGNGKIYVFEYSR